jgi:hypothetical protein
MTPRGALRRYEFTQLLRRRIANPSLTPGNHSAIGKLVRRIPLLNEKALMNRIPFYCAAALASFCGLTFASVRAQEGNDLRPLSAFSEITDTTARSRALFGEMAK